MIPKLHETLVNKNLGEICGFRTVAHLERLNIVAHQKRVLRQIWFPYLIYCFGHFFLVWLWCLKGCYRASRREYRRILWERLFVRRFADAPAQPDLVYAIGIGEMRAAAKFLQVLKSSQKTDGVILCETEDLLNVSFSGVQAYPAPFNNPFSVLKTFLTLRPKTIWIVETIKNHHFKAFAALLGIPMVMINTHDSVRDDVSGGGADWRVPLIGLYAVQSESEVLALTKELVDKHFVRKTGPIALGCPATESSGRDMRVEYAARLKIESGAFPVVLAGSTHLEDEVVILDAFCLLLKDWPDAQLVLAPRYIKRSIEIESLVENIRLRARRRSSDDGVPGSQVVILDSIGELRDAYSVADLAVVGGTFGTRVGGHTPMEAFGWKVPITTGPYFDHQRVSMELLRNRGLVNIVNSADEMFNGWKKLLLDPGLKAKTSEKAAMLQSEFDAQTVAVYDLLHREYIFS